MQTTAGMFLEQEDLETPERARGTVLHVITGTSSVLNEECFSRYLHHYQLQHSQREKAHFLHAEAVSIR